MSKSASILLALIFLSYGFIGHAQSKKPADAQKPADTRKTADSQKAADVEGEKRATVTTDEALQRAISGLANQISILSSEVRKLRQESERTSATMELLINEERLGKVEQQLEEALQQKIQLDAREQEIQRRQRNVQQEVALRGGLRRDEAEAALRTELQRALEDTRSQQNVYQQRIAELQANAERLRKRVEALRKKIEPAEEKDEEKSPAREP